MKKFLFQAGKFLLVFVVILGSSYMFNSYLYHKFVAEINPKNKVIFIGDSHLMRGINDELISDAVNISQPGESYVSSKLKLEKILTGKKSLAKDAVVVVSFNYHNIAVQSDNKFLNDDGTLQYLERYWPLLSLESLKSYNIDKKKFFKTFVKLSVLPNFTYAKYLYGKPKKNHGIAKVSYIGKFMPSEGNNYQDNLAERIEAHYGTDTTRGVVGYKSGEELENILALCKAHNIKLVLLKMPVTVDYYSRVPNILKQYRDSLETSLKLQGAEVVDLELYFKDRTYFNDADHLNRAGADSVSRLLGSVLGGTNGSVVNN